MTLAKLQSIMDGRKARRRIELECDKLWSQIVKARAEYSCEKCKRKGYLNAHHVITRSVKVLRWEVDNGVCLCPGCHTLSSDFSAHKTPIEFVDWFGRDRYDALVERKRNHLKTDIATMRVIKMDLEDKLRRITGGPLA